MDFNIWPTYLKLFVKTFFYQYVWLKNTIPMYVLGICPEFPSFLFWKALLGFIYPNIRHLILIAKQNGFLSLSCGVALSCFYSYSDTWEQCLPGIWTAKHMMNYDRKDSPFLEHFSLTIFKNHVVHFVKKATRIFLNTSLTNLYKIIQLRLLNKQIQKSQILNKLWTFNFSKMMYLFKYKHGVSVSYCQALLQLSA